MTLSKLIVIESWIKIKSSQSQQELAQWMSDHIFGGIKFVVSEARDEIPCVQLERPIFSLFVLLIGNHETYDLEVFTLECEFDKVVQISISREFRHISDYIAQCLSRNSQIEQLTVLA